MSVKDDLVRAGVWGTQADDIIAATASDGLLGHLTTTQVAALPTAAMPTLTTTDLPTLSTTQLGVLNAGLASLGDITAALKSI